MSDAPFSVMTPTGYNDLILSIVKQVRSDYHSMKSFVRYLKGTMFEDWIVDAVAAATRRVDKFLADMIAFYDLALMLWSEISPNLQLALHIISVLFDVSCPASLAGPIRCWFPVDASCNGAPGLDATSWRGRQACHKVPLDQDDCNVDSCKGPWRNHISRIRTQGCHPN
jgi:hypothetical protein